MTNPIYLKVKANSLAAEARIIRKLEQRMKQARANKAYRAGELILSVDNMGKSRECWQVPKPPLPEAWFGLNAHRRGKVRQAARTAHLARNWLRGNFYAQVEQKCAEPPSVAEIARLLKEYAGQPPGINGTIADWLLSGAPGMPQPPRRRGNAAAALEVPHLPTAVDAALGG